MTADIEGKTVEYIIDPEYRGVVIGDSVRSPGLVQVQWTRPERFIGIHSPNSLRVVAS